MRRTFRLLAHFGMRAGILECAPEGAATVLREDAGAEVLEGAEVVIATEELALNVDCRGA